MKYSYSIVKYLTIAALCISVTACLKPYQPNVTQGNKINNGDLAQLRQGMGKREVMYILGTPLVNDPFLQTRWDYYYSDLDRQKNKTTTRVITVIFKDDVLEKLEGDVMLEQLSTLEPSEEDIQHGGSIITEPTQKKQGIFSRKR